MTVFLKLSIIVFFISSPFALGGALVSLNWIDDEILFKVVCVFFAIWGLALAISGYAPDYKDQIQALADRWNRRPDISTEEVKAHCRARNYVIVAAELFFRMARGITYRADEMPIDGTAAYRIGGDSKTLWLTVPNGSVKGDKIGNRVIIQEESTPFVKTYYTEDIAP